jgi:hypothetical protein
VLWECLSQYVRESRPRFRAHDLRRLQVVGKRADNAAVLATESARKVPD